MPEINYIPSVDMVGLLERTRTVDTLGSELGTFTDMTRPTDTQVEELIAVAADSVAIMIGQVVPDRLVSDAQRMVSLGTALLIEMTFFPEQVATGRSAYEQYKTMYDEQLKLLQQAVSDAEEEEGDDTALTSGMAHFSFPVNKDGLIGWGSRW